MPDSLKQNVKAAIEAAGAGHAELLHKILKECSDVIRHPGPLCAAALHGQTAVAVLLLKAGADVDAVVPSQASYRPLHRAIEHCGVKKNAGHVPTVQALLAAGADVSLRSTWMGLTALTTAAMGGDDEMIALVLRQKPSVDFYTATILLDKKTVNTYLKKKPALARARDENEMTALHYLALSGREGTVCDQDSVTIAEALLDCGADVDAVADIGPYKDIAVLHFAAKRNIPLVRFLLENGANPNLGFGSSLWREPGEMAQLFLAYGGDVNGREEHNQPILHSRIHWNLPSVALWLLENGADPNLLDEQGNTALHKAARRGINVKVVKALLEKGVKPKVKNQAGETALDIALAKKKMEIAALLSSA